MASRANSRVKTRARPALSGMAVLAALTLAALPLAWRALERLAALLRFPYPHDGLEGTLLHEARLLWSGAALYQPLERFRFVSAPYPPLHALLIALADQFAGPHVFWSGRLISLAAALGVAILVVLTVRSAARSWLGGAIGAALLLSAPPTLLWATRIKPDLLALLFTALGLYLATRAIDSAKDQRPKTKDGGSDFGPWSFALGPSSIALCFALAFFTKQTAVAAPLATGLALIIGDARAFPGFKAPLGQREHAGYIGRLPLRWPTFVFGIAYAALTLGVWLLLDALTAGQFSAHVWGLHLGEWWSFSLFRKFAALLAPYAPAALLAAWLFLRSARDGRGLMVACYALTAPISLLGAGETGANHNHLLETLLALALATGCMAGWAVDLSEGRTKLLSAAIFAVLAAQIGLAYQPQAWYGNELAPRDTPERYLDYIRATPGEILADDVALLVAAGRALRYDDPSTMGPAARSGVWDQSGLIQDIAERKFSAIMLPINVENHLEDPAGRWTPEVLAAVRAHYRLAFSDTIDTYVPR